MDNEKKIENILINVYSKSIEEIEKDKGKSFLTNNLSENQKEWLLEIILKSESFKAIITVLTTSLVKKIENPQQDVRKHRSQFQGGYSGRTLDTKFITPFFKQYFNKFAMKESGWLTRSLEQPYPFNLDFPGRIKDPKVKDSFLKILHDIEVNKANPESYLIALFIMLNLKIISHQQLFSKNINKIDNEKNLTINFVIESLKQHFFSEYKSLGASKLPVIALYSVYEILIKDIARYRGKKLLPLKSHIASDIKAKEIGDIEIVDETTGAIFEGIEVKHEKSIDFLMLHDVYEKIKGISSIKRYYILTTAEPNIKKEEKNKILKRITEIKEEHGCEIIVNDLIKSIKYYLRLLEKPEQFLNYYYKNLQKEFLNSAEIKEEHVIKWQEIIKEIKGQS